MALTVLKIHRGPTYIVLSHCAPLKNPAGAPHVTREHRKGSTSIKKKLSHISMG